MQKISLLYLFILQIQAILENIVQTGYNYFWPRPLKKIFHHLLICVNLYYLAKKQKKNPVNSICSFLKYSKF